MHSYSRDQNEVKYGYKQWVVNSEGEGVRRNNWNVATTEISIQKKELSNDDFKLKLKEFKLNRPMKRMEKAKMLKLNYDTITLNLQKPNATK